MLRSGGQEQGFVLKMESDGRSTWANLNASDESSRNENITIDAEGNAVVSGFFTGKIDLNPASDNEEYFSSNGFHDIFVQKLAADGAYLWGASYGGSSDEAHVAVDVDNVGSVLVTGEFRGNVNFDGTSAQAFGNGDIFIVKLDEAGKQVFAKAVGAT